jgi:hypothetical protein
MRHTLLSQRLENLFVAYQQAFAGFNAKQVRACYQLPCSLTMPDEFIVVNDEAQFKQEFEKIFQQLQQANTKSFSISNASYQTLNKQLILVCINWSFIDDNDLAFAEFSAFYHVTDINNTLQIVHVTSQPSEQSVTLDNPINFAHLQQLKVIT